MSDEIKRLEAEVAELYRKAREAPMSGPGSPSTAWARFSREHMAAKDRLEAAKARMSCTS